MKRKLAESQPELQEKLRKKEEVIQQLQSQSKKLQAQLDRCPPGGGERTCATGRGDPETLLTPRQDTSTEAELEAAVLKVQQMIDAKEVAEESPSSEGSIATSVEAPSHEKDMWEDSQEEAGQSRLEMQQELEKLKALNSSSDSEKTALKAQVASLEAELKCVKSEIGAVQSLRDQVSRLEEELTNAEARVATHEDKKAEMQEKIRKFRAAQEKRHEKLGTRVSFSDSCRNSCSSQEQEARDEATAIQALRDEKQRAAAWKQLLLKSHPDKNHQNVEVATHVFHMLQNWRWIWPTVAPWRPKCFHGNWGKCFTQNPRTQGAQHKNDTCMRWTTVSNSF